ncbi:LacI family transcriptional regulator [Microbacterium sp. kSW2-24]|uniref:LacI family DNA-binding transcriptional regulator n=1 Tax=Microbacterium galbinum TaxID=2851646 RepID=UPI001FFCB6F0|nr:LacI family DNA-binding transcriptional regulator [Microbacterium galbinum]MCK2022697.1 LacI family transcriptional regulator [Microbacterium galbinum]
MTTTHGSLKPATSSDVARLAGVSRSTVSNILNGNDARFPESTRERVFTAARELEYQPSLAGRSLVSGRSDTIVLLVPHTSFGGNLQDAVDQIMVGTRQIGGNVVVRFASENAETTRGAINSLRPLALVDFGVLSTEDREWLEARGTIIVPSRGAQRATVSDGGIGTLQADVLLESGPRELWFAALSDKRFDPYGPGRFAALESYCTERGLPSPRQVSVELTLDGGVAALREILDVGRPAGVACYNDDVALALLAAARELGVSVPKDISIVGVDYTPLGQLWAPTLTTIDTDLRGLVTSLAEDLRSRLSGADADAAAVPHLHFRVVRGQSA